MSKGTPTRGIRKFKNANFMLPEDFTNQLIQMVEALPDCRAVTHLKSQWLTKFVSSDTKPASDRRDAAIEKWLLTESRNAETNDRIVNMHEEFNILPRVTWSKFVAKARDIVNSLLGDTIPEDALIGGFSGGASTSKRRTESQPASKYFGKADITADAMPSFISALELCPGWDLLRNNLEVRIVRGNILFTVPKNADIDRCAAKEPDLNMFLQKGAGSFIRSKLKQVGIDLNDQSRNRNLARLGSRTGDLCTLDLSSASDSISYAIVEALLPDLWFSHLNSIRSPITVIDGVEHCNEMFSSMGNGFTFELETLVFYSLVRTVAYFRGVSGIISVYGDDIICPSVIAEDVMFVFSQVGFTVNPEKSFWTGSFRESCGGHYNDGYDITPFYLREPVTRLTHLIRLGNQIRRWAGHCDWSLLDPSVEHIWLFIRDRVPERFWGGRDFGADTSLVTPDQPRFRLVEVQTKKSAGAGGFAFWLNTTWDRGCDLGAETLKKRSRLLDAGFLNLWFESKAGRAAIPEGVETSTFSISTTNYRARPVSFRHSILLSGRFPIEVTGCRSETTTESLQVA